VLDGGAVLDADGPVVTSLQPEDRAGDNRECPLVGMCSKSPIDSGHQWPSPTKDRRRQCHPERGRAWVSR
jgi:hypothetical protein